MITCFDYILSQQGVLENTSLKNTFKKNKYCEHIWLDVTTLLLKLRNTFKTTDKSDEVYEFIQLI